MNNKICNKCNYSNNQENKYCVNCGNKFDEEIIKSNNIDIQSEKEGDKWAIISIILFVLPIPLNRISAYLKIYSISSITSFSTLAGIVTMICGRVKYPKNKTLKIAMWVIIAIIILAILFSIFILIFFMVACSKVNPQSCG